MRDLSGVRVVGPLEPYAAGFRAELARRGYSLHTALIHLRLMGHLSRWLAGAGQDGSGLTAAQVEVYLRQRRRAQYRSGCTGRALAPVLGYLRRLGVAPASESSDPGSGPVEVLLARYARYLDVERGLAKTTVRRNVDLVRPFLAARERAGRVDLRGLAAGDVIGFVLAGCRGARGGSATRMVTALRSLLRYLHVDGLIDQPLVAVVPSVAAWKLKGLPNALSAEQVEALLTSCDQATVVGRRDFAIVTVLARLGLRAGEVAGLQLDDMDWRRGELTVRGKGNRAERLPLPVDVGQAVVS